MNKIKFLFLIFLSLFIFSGCGSSNFKSISYTELTNKLDNKDTFFFVVIKDDCRYCEAFKPKMEKVLDEYDVVGYKLNISDMSEKEYKDFQNQFNVDSTPTTVFIYQGKEVSVLLRLEGNQSEEIIISTLKENNYIK